MSLGLGLDTGGTFTDAVIIDDENGTVLCKAKSRTTHEDLSIGISDAIKMMDSELLRKVTVVSLSSTLATNSVVEGKGCRVGLICMGCDYDRSVPVEKQICVTGKHDLHGNETEPPDYDAVREFLEGIRGTVDSIAVTGYMSVRNPEHETAVKSIVTETLGIPAVCGHELSSGLGFNERTSTCIMNAGLLPVIRRLIAAVKEVMAESEIDAPLLIVRGDGTLMGEKAALEKPVETIMSGPAASMIGAMHITGKKDAIVMDMGGTTTDIGILRNGKPRLEKEGAVIGGKRTRVLAAEISTSGIGGDSRIFVRRNKICLSATRVIPLCVASERWEYVKDCLSELRSCETRKTSESDRDCDIILDTEFFWSIADPDAVSDITENDREFMRLTRDVPKTLCSVASEMGIYARMINSARLEERGYVQRIGLTPTDILHADGLFTEYGRTASMNAVEYMSRMIHTTADEFIKMSKEAIRDKLSLELVKELLMEETGNCTLDTNALDMVTKCIRHESGKDYSCRMSVNKPIIGIGAPCGIYIGWMRDVFGCEVIIHPNSDVGNAIGAITSVVSESVKFLIKPTVFGNDEGAFEVFSEILNSSFESLNDAVSAAYATGSEYVVEKLRNDGITNPTVSVIRNDKTFSYGDEYGDGLMEIEYEITAVGKPDSFV